MKKLIPVTNPLQRTTTNTDVLSEQVALTDKNRTL